jgi:anthranilate phosphoribosyltransferase
MATSIIQTDLSDVLARLAQGSSLTRAEAAEALRAVMTGSVSEMQTAALLTALRTKGETIDEVAGFAETMRAHARQVTLDVGDRQVVDTCGTGGDGHNTFNVSTTAAFVVAGAGVPVAKHGNRAASSQTGSADLLEALGATVVASPGRVAAAITTTGFGFMLAPEYHPAMRHVMPVRRGLGFPTVFNILGPLSNPAGVRRQVIGVRDIATARTMANVLQQLGSDRVLIVTSCEGADELTLSGTNHLVDYDRERGSIDEYQLDPLEYGLARTDLSAIRGGNAAHNAVLTRRVLDGEAGAYRETVVLNAAAALLVAGRASTIGDGLAIAAESIDSGSARRVVDEFIAFSNQPVEEAVA